MSIICHMTSSTRQTTQNIKYELAERISNPQTACEQILKFIFDEIITHLETLYKTEFPPLIKKGVWENFSKKNLKELKGHFHREFCDQVLVGFTEGQVCEMLEHHRKTNEISAQLKEVFISKQPRIIDIVVKQANLKKSMWKEEISETSVNT